MRKKERVIITVCALSIIILIGLAWFWLVPLVEQKNLEYKIIQADIAKYEEGIADLNKAKSLIDNAGTINGLPVTEEKILNTLPYSEEKEDIYALIENMAISAGITEPISMGVNQTTPSESGVELIPITLATKGSYGNLTSFIDLFQKKLRPVIINSLDIFPTEDGGLSLSITASAYSLTSATTQDTQAIEGGGAAINDGLEQTSNLEARAELNNSL